MEEKPDIAKIKLETHVTEHDDRKPPKMPVLSTLLATPVKTIPVVQGVASLSMNPKAETLTSQKPQDSSHLVAELPEVHRDSTNEACISPQSPDPADGEITANVSGYENGAKFKCSICNSQFRYQSKLKQHMTLHTEEKPHECSVCERTFKRISNLREHMQTHTGVKPHGCSVCGKRFRRADRLQQHKQIHTRENLHNSTSNEESRESSELDQHMSIPGGVDAYKPLRTTNESYPTPQCIDSHSQRGVSMSLNIADSIKHHVSIQEAPNLSDPEEELVGINEACTSAQAQNDAEGRMPVEGSVFESGANHDSHTCSICSKRFMNPSELSRHLVNHAGKNSNKCPVCNRTFSRRRNLRLHIMVHTGERPYACSLCNSTFNRSRALSRHMVVHTGEKEYTGEKKYHCSVCNNSYTQAGSLRQHMLVHKAGDNLHRCSVCYQGFTRSRNLRQHMKLHTGEMPYKCSVCKEGFQDASRLGQHMTMHMGVRAQKGLAPTDKLYSSPQVVDPTVDAEMYQNVYPNASDDDSTYVHYPREQLVHTELNSISQFKDNTFGTPTQNVCQDIRTSTQPQNISQYVKQELRETLVRSDAESTDKIPKFVKASYSKSRKRAACENETDGKSYKCSFCNKCYHLSKYLRRHMKIHTGQRRHRCSICNLLFLRAEDVRRHMITHTGEKPYKCSVCSVRFTQSGTLNRHVKLHHSEVIHKCSLCNKGFLESSQLDQHMNIHTKFADMCLVPTEKAHTSPRSTESTVDAVISQNMYKWSVCNMGFSRAGPLMRHMKTHTEEKPHQCSMCNMAFSRADKLKRHMMSHTVKRPHKCSVCNMRFHRSETLIRHMKTHPHEDPHMSSVCNEVFQESSQHMKIHTKKAETSVVTTDKPCTTQQSTEPTVNDVIPQNVYSQACSICHRRLSSRNELLRHMMTHTGERPHKCTVCNKGFMRADRLRKHMLSHEGDKPHHCSICSMQFPQLSELNQHMTIHTGVKAEQCLVPTERPCTTVDSVKPLTLHQNFNIPTALQVDDELPDLPADQLQSHMIPHARYRPHQCSVCHVRFTQAKSLHRHMKSHNNELLHNCSVCNKSFTRRDKLQQHLKTHDKGTLQESFQCVDESPYFDYLKEHLVTTEESSSSTLVIEPPSGTIKSEKMDWDAPQTPDNSFVDGVPDVSYLDEHVVTSDQLCSTPQSKVPTGGNISDKNSECKNTETECPICHKKVLRAATLRRHMLIHSGEKPHACTICGRGFNQAGNLRVHMMIHTGDRPHKCSLCNKGFRRSGELRQHMCSTVDKPHKCPICNIRFTLPSGLSRHMKAHLQQTPNTASTGNTKFQQSIQIDKQLTAHKDIKADTSILQNGFQDVHVSTQSLNSFPGVSGVRPSNSQGVRYSSNIQESGRQTVTNRDVKPHKCPLCSIRFRKVAILQQHLLLHKTGELKESPQDDVRSMPQSEPEKVGKFYKCSVCNKEVRYLSRLKRHMKMHSGDRHKVKKTYKCSVCNKELGFLCRLKRHMKMHINDNTGKTYKCTLCDTEVRSLSNLKQHMRTHSEDRNNAKKSYKCAVCNKEVEFLSVLKRHMKSHSGDRHKIVSKFHKCYVCNKRIRYLSHLKRHMESHSEAKTYECPVCKQAFKQPRSLKQHMRMHTRKTQCGVLKTEKMLDLFRFNECHECPSCITGFTDDEELSTHMITHKEEVQCEIKPLQLACEMKPPKPHQLARYEWSKCQVCSQCVRGFTREHGLTSHMTMNHKELNSKRKRKACHKCSLCSQVFSTGKYLRRHMISHSKRKLSKCTVCNREFRFPYQHKQHMFTHTGERHFKCSLCSQRFMQAKNLRRHMRIHSGEKPYKCSICNRSFSQPANLRHHKRIHTGERPYKCSVCNKSFTHPTTLYRHKKIHTREIPEKHSLSPLKASMITQRGERPYKCSMCNMWFISLGNLHQHMMIHTEKPALQILDLGHDEHLSNSERLHSTAEQRPCIDEKPHTCTVCGVKFRRLSVLEQHMLLHNNAVPNVSTLYGNTAITKRDFEETRSNTFKAPFKSSLCNMEFPEQNHLNVHMMTHNHEKPYKCSLCSKEFSLAHNLRRHMAIHTGESPYKCYLCEKLCSTAGNLKQHMMIHTGERPHKCTVCNKAFTLPRILHQHMLIHTGVKPYECSVCGKRFTQYGTMSHHKKTHMRKIPQTLSASLSKDS